MILEMLAKVQSGLVDADNAIDPEIVAEGSVGFQERMELIEVRLDSLLRRLQELMEWSKPEERA